MYCQWPSVTRGRDAKWGGRKGCWDLGGHIQDLLGSRRPYSVSAGVWQVIFRISWGLGGHIQHPLRPRRPYSACVGAPETIFSIFWGLGSHIQVLGLHPQAVKIKGFQLGLSSLGWGIWLLCNDGSEGRWCKGRPT